MAVPEESINIQVRHQVFIERLKSGFYRDFDAVLNQLGKESVDAIVSLDVEKMSDLPKRDLNSLIVGLRALSISLLDQQVADFVNDLSKLSQSETKFEVDSIKAVTIRTPVERPAAGNAFTFANNLPIRATGDLPKKFFSKMNSNEADQLAAVIRKGWSDGATIPQMVQRVRGTRLTNFQDGYTKQAKARVEAEVRTATQHYSSRSREKVWEDNKEIIDGYQWVSTLDSRTSQQCRSLDGRKYEVGEGPMPPIHFNCRSTTVPVLDDSLNFLDEDATRASQKGPVDADKTYYSWLKDQPANFQNEAIGPTRAKLLRDGGLSSEQFSKLNLNRNFEPLTLQEMEERNPIAFEKAGID